MAAVAPASVKVAIAAWMSFMVDAPIWVVWTVCASLTRLR
jgi:hypothetical protein